MQPNTAASNTQESNITDMVGLFVRNKWRGFLIVCGVILLGVAMSFLLPKQYQTSELLRLAAIDNHPVESVESIVTFFGTDVALREIASESHLALPEVRDRFVLKGLNEGGSMKIEGYGPTPEEAMAMTQLVSRKILARSQDTYQPARDVFEKEMATLSEEQGGIREEVVRLEKVGERLSAEIRFYQSEIAKRADAQSEAQGRIVETYIRLLADAKLQQDGIAQAITSAKQRSVVLAETMQRKQSTLNYSLRPPILEAESIMPNASIIPQHLTQNIIYSTVLGVFLAIVWILVQEYHIVRSRKLP